MIEKTSTISEVMMMERDSIKQILADHNLKLSEQRIQILGFMLSTESHPTADDIYRHLTTADPILSRATVYNTLKSFLDTGVIRALELRDNETRYDATVDEHGHFRCRICDRIENFDVGESLFSLELPGHLIEGHSLTLRGICPQCLARKQPQKNNADQRTD